MAAFKNEKNGTWYVQFRYTDWKGERQQKFKRGFATKREAQEWEREFLMQKQADVTMSFESFAELYEKDVKPRLKENTWLTKESIIQKKILPYFAKRRLCDITAKDVIEWQNEIRKLTDKSGRKYSQTYLKTVHNQLSALFNHAVRYYGLKSNPAAIAGNMGTEERKEMQFWTLEEYKKFSEAMMDKTISFYAFEMLYWCGINYVLDSVISLASMASNVYVQDLSDSADEVRATISTGLSVNHLITIAIALAGGWIWQTLGIETLFMLSAVLGLCNSAYAATIQPAHAIPKE